MAGLLSAQTTMEQPEALVRRAGRVSARFDRRTQDSGNLSWLVDTAEGAFFIKTAGTPGPPVEGAPAPYLDHDRRVALLRNAVDLARSCPHPCLVRLRNVIESPWGPMLVYERAAGELVGTSSTRRADPTSVYQRFARLRADRLLGVFDALVDLHQILADLGWVASDLYDGCLMVDLPTGRLTVIDLDSYRRGPSLNTMGRMFGSTRFMAPEEFRRDAPIDQRTTVFNLGRLVWHFATRLTERSDQFCGSPALRAAVEQATAPDRDERPESVDAFAAAWRAARTIGPPFH